MKLLEEKILKDGKILPGNVLKVDSFLNHQIDTAILSKCADEWYEIFKDSGVTKILTIESSGIAIATLTAERLGIPLLFAKKISVGNPGGDFYKIKVVSYTHGHEYTVIAPKKFISENDKILVIDDFLANGTAMKALISLSLLGGAEIVGCGAVIEKVYQNGGNDIRSMGYKVESLAKISSMSDDHIEFC